MVAGTDKRKIRKVVKKKHASLVAGTDKRKIKKVVRNNTLQW